MQLNNCGLLTNWGMSSDDDDIGENADIGALESEHRCEEEEVDSYSLQLKL